MSELKNIPSWMQEADYPIPEIKEYVQKLKEAENKAKNPVAQVVQNVLPTPTPAVAAASPAESQEGVNLTEGVVLLIWKDDATEHVTMEDDKYPTSSAFSISMFKDFNTTEEMKDVVKSFQAMIEEYNQKSPARKGTYAIVVGRLVKGMKKKIIEIVDVEF